MKLTQAFYEHTRLGFPGVVLKWHTEADGVPREPRITVNKIIQPWQWSDHPYTRNVDIDKEIKRFDDWVSSRFANDASVQG